MGNSYCYLNIRHSCLHLEMQGIDREVVTGEKNTCCRQSYIAQRGNAARRWLSLFRKTVALCKRRIIQNTKVSFLGCDGTRSDIAQI